MDKYTIDIILASLIPMYENSTEDHIHHIVLSHGDIREVSKNGKELRFKYLNNELKQIVNINNDTLGNKVIKVVVEGEFDVVDSFRGIYFNLLKSCAKKRYVIKDEVSSKLCADSYIYINKIENLLRQYIMNFMILKVGDEWWELNVSDQDKEKSSKRNDKAAFGSLINQDIYHIDFKDLLSFIYDNFSGFKTKNEVLNRLKACSTITEFTELKNSIMSNKERFFGGIFDNGFKNKWEELAELRNSIAHNKLFERKNYNKVIELCGVLEGVLNVAISELQNYEISEAESEVYRETIQQERNSIVISNLAKLEESYGIDMDKIKQAIQKISTESSEDYFTLRELVKELMDEEYVTKAPINSYLGFILGNAKNELNLERGPQRMQYTDENNVPTTLTMWKLTQD